MSTLRQIATEPSNLNNSYFSNQNSAHKTISLSESVSLTISFMLFFLSLFNFVHLFLFLIVGNKLQQQF